MYLPSVWSTRCTYSTESVVDGAGRRPPERPGWLTLLDRLGGLVVEVFRPLCRPCCWNRRQAVRTPGTVSDRIAARSWMPGALAVGLVHPLCLPDRARCVPVHLALPLPSRFAGPDWGDCRSKPVPGEPVTWPAVSPAGSFSGRQLCGRSS